MGLHCIKRLVLKNVSELEKKVNKKPVKKTTVKKTDKKN